MSKRAASKKDSKTYGRLSKTKTRQYFYFDITHSTIIYVRTEQSYCVLYIVCTNKFSYRGADKSLARTGRKQANVSVRIA